MGVRNRLSGTLSIQNRVDQLKASWRFWLPIIFTVTAAVYSAGLYYLCAKKYSPASVLFYVQFTLEGAYHLTAKLNGQIDQAHALAKGFYLWLSMVISPAKSLVNFHKSGGTDKELIELIQGIGTFLHSLNVATACVFTATTLSAFAIARWEVKRQTEDRIIRGAKLLPWKILNKLLKKQYGQGSLTLGKLVLPRRIENLSMILVGKPQQGKTVIFNHILTEIQRRKQQAICFCAKSEDFITTHYRPDYDLVFCPGADLRSVSWSLKNDIKSVEDFAVIANVLAPVNPQDKSPMWQKGEVMTMKALLRHWFLCTDKSNQELARIAKLSQEEMAEVLKNTPECEDAFGLICNLKSMTANSFYITCLCDLQPLQLLGKSEGNFSITEWLRSGRNTIYLPCSDRLEASLAPLYAMFLELTAINHMDMSQDRDRRVWLLADELPAIGKITKLSNWLNKAPSYGLAAVLGTQSIGLLDIRYGEETRRSIMNACNTSVVFCLEDTKSATEIAERVGSDEREKSKQSLNTASVELRDGVTVMAETKKDFLVSPDELRNLLPLNCYIRIAGLGTTKMKIKYLPYKSVNPAFVQNPAFSLVTAETQYRQLRANADKMRQDYLANMTVKSKDHSAFLSSQKEDLGQQQDTDEQLTQIIININGDDGRSL
jgi:hypothetical protein